MVISAHDSCEEAGGSSDLPVTKIDSPSPYVFSGDKREGMGLLKYQALPSLRDVRVAHDGVLCTFSPRLAKVVWSVRACGMDRPSRTR